ncbi:hybrid sensor histidine kinase/response regulator [Leptolyngbya iicbica]|uniref:histidine kinase n=2 Tax=Cyanophyceae TaxID=3028117 RepID=A0A4Q7E750_9CYAN|nr:response regulator [Leptolyngbya sp. LK]RZM77899.1 response regulator [Leptolyngbya sp. LK]
MTKLLVIEDEVGIRDSIVDILQAEDYIVESASNGQEGLEVIEEFHPDLVICDVMMPILDGHGVLKKIRNNPQTQTLPFIFLTAKADKIDFREGMDLGANDYITKPFTHDELLSTIQSRLKLKAAAHQETKKQLEILRTSVNNAIPREIATYLEEIWALSHSLSLKADTLPTAGIVGLAKAINRNAQQMAELIEKLMFSAQLESLDPHAERAIAMRQQRTEHADEVLIKIAHTIAKDFLRDADLELMAEPASAQVSASNFKWICQEIIANAFKFSEEGSPVKVVCASQNQAFVFYVIDYGKGMTPEEIDNIGAYLQFSEEGTQHQGVGLGLAIAKKLVELHHGSFVIESIPKKQTIVRITLPAVAVNH